MGELASIVEANGGDGKPSGTSRTNRFGEDRRTPRVTLMPAGALLLASAIGCRITFSLISRQRNNSMSTIRMRKVFVPGGQPEYTYVARTELQLEPKISAASDNLCKLVIPFRIVDGIMWTCQRYITHR